MDKNHHRELYDEQLGNACVRVCVYACACMSVCVRVYGLETTRQR